MLAVSLLNSDSVIFMQKKSSTFKVFMIFKNNMFPIFVVELVHKNILL